MWGIQDDTSKLKAFSFKKLWAKNMRQYYTSCSLNVLRNILRKNIFLRNIIFCFFSGFSRNVLAGLPKQHSMRPEGQSEERFLFPKNFLILYFFGLLAKRFRPHCQNCIPPVQIDILRHQSFKKTQLFLVLVQILGKKSATLNNQYFKCPEEHFEEIIFFWKKKFFRVFG